MSYLEDYDVSVYVVNYADIDGRKTLSKMRLTQPGLPNFSCIYCIDRLQVHLEMQYVGDQPHGGKDGEVLWIPFLIEQADFRGVELAPAVFPDFDPYWAKREMFSFIKATLEKALNSTFSGRPSAFFTLERKPTQYMSKMLDVFRTLYKLELPKRGYGPFWEMYPRMHEHLLRWSDVPSKEFPKGFVPVWPSK
jgi:hypothetical protein